MGQVLKPDFRVLRSGAPRRRLMEFADAVLKDQTRARDAIAQYLHDTLLQTLVVLSFTCDEEAAGRDESVAELISQCCRQARVVTSLLSTPFSGDGDACELIRLVLENLKEDAGIDVDFRFEPPGALPAGLSNLIFDIVMEFVFVLIVDRSTAPHSVLFTCGSGWITLDLPAAWGKDGRSLSTLSRLRIEGLAGCVEGSGEGGQGHGRMYVRLPVEPDESSNSDCR